MRAVTLRSQGTAPCDGSVGLKLGETLIGRKFDPARPHRGDTVRRRAHAACEGHSRLEVLQVCIGGAALQTAGARSPWKKAADPAAVFLPSSGKLRWRAERATLPSWRPTHE